MIETPARIEPCFLESVPATITDKCVDLTARANNLAGYLPDATIQSLAQQTRIMNCYYSNLIEGHNTMPKDIERALQSDFDTDQKRRNLQIEARAHIQLQEKIDTQHMKNTLPDPACGSFIKMLHTEFYAGADESMLRVENPHNSMQSFTMTPGTYRSENIHDVTVGRHQPPSSTVVDAFMDYFSKKYSFEQLGSGQRVIAMALAHHRFNYIHPFPDGNGRVSRLMSHAMALKAGIGAGGLWSIARGLARGIPGKPTYKNMMDYADSPRMGDLDGRGNLSLRASIEFIEWFLDICIDQVDFMHDLYQIDYLDERLQKLVELKKLRPEALPLLQRVLREGELARGDAERITGLGARSTRMILSSLVELGILGSTTPKGPVSLRFPSAIVDIMFPRLFPET